MSMSRLTKQDSQAIKGIAIWLMLIHHLFYSADTFRGMPVEFFILDTNTAISIAQCAKICVPLFVFVTAYGLTAKYNSVNQSRHMFEAETTKRYVNLMIPFWVVFLIMQIICNVVGECTISQTYGEGYGAMLYIVIDALGLACGFQTPTLCVTWWYMSLATLLIFIVPILWRGVVQFGYIFFFPALLLFQFVEWDGYFDYIVVAILGVIVYERNIFDAFIKTYKGNKWLHSIGALSMAVIVLVICGIIFVKTGYEFKQTIFCCSVLAIVYIQKKFLCKLERLTRILAHFGKHSMNIFLIHPFIIAVFFHKEIYSLKYGILILLSAMVISLICSYIVELLKKVIKIDVLQKYIVNRIQGYFC